MELTVLMPCLNEAETVATCVRKARRFLGEHDIDGEVLVADNGSTDGSQRLARDAGASVISIPDTGYGNAVLGGIAVAQGQFIIMGDSDDSYDFTALMPFLDRLRAGAELVMGNRFRGGIVPGAMPALHRYLGNPVLSAIGRLFFRSRIGDFHCGLRGFRRDSVLLLALQASGMELASEMIVKATLAGQQVEEVPTRLSRDGRSRPPHLRRWRDGWRHLRFLLLFSPRWLFLIPGTVLLISGLIFGAAAGPTAPPGVPPTTILDDLVAASAMTVIGFQAIQFAVFTKVYASAEGFLQQRSWLDRLLSACSLERGLIAGGLLAAAGLRQPGHVRPRLARARLGARREHGPDRRAVTDCPGAELPGDPGHVLHQHPGHPPGRAAGAAGGWGRRGRHPARAGRGARRPGARP